MLLPLFLLVLWCFAVPAEAQRLRDAEINQTLHEFQRVLYRAARLESEDAEVVLINSDQVNAFVRAGRNIYIYSGLITKTETLGEFIGVMAHETAHIAGGHIARQQIAQNQASSYKALSFLAGTLLGVATGNATVGIGVAVAGSDTSRMTMFSHSRREEMLADREALTIMDRLNFPLYGLRKFTEKLARQEYLPVSQQLIYYRTHPTARNRALALSRTEDKMTEDITSESQQRLWPVGWNLQFQRLRAKLIGYTNPHEALRLYQNKNDFVSGYGRGAAHLRQKNFEAAHSEFQALLALSPEDPWVHELIAETWFAAGQLDKAVTAIRKARLYANDEPDLLERFALMLLALETPAAYEEARQAVEIGLGTRSNSPGLWRVKAQIHGKLNETALADLSHAEQAFSQGDLDRAKIFARRALAGFDEGTPNHLRAQDLLLLQ